VGLGVLQPIRRGNRSASAPGRMNADQLFDQGGQGPML
jgi:hypothetical protein